MVSCLPRKLLTRMNSVCPSEFGGRDFFCPTAMKVVQQRSVECEGHAGAQSKAWPSTAAEIVPRCNDVFVPLDSDFQGRESGIVSVQRLFHENIIHAQVTSRTSIIPSQHPVTSHFILHQVIHDSHSSQTKSCGDGGMAKQQVEVTTGSFSHDPARRRPWTSGRSSLYPGHQRSPAASWATEQPFLGQHCSP